ncbi:hypothetical protein [Chondromyces crocatus]|uniref:Uncharacterized protein n=1 Tax=Chondromyces crocatus TaxID=52 RepID=A0A0K1E6Q4_CHOCO|nr:hypothetical protein [Chondromyces crocatus]AKT36534.1 uncharacterized protein CMC5_006500 [Chondromyces crocatus]
MKGRPLQVAVVVALVGAGVMALFASQWPPSRVAPAGIGAAVVLLTTSAVLRELRRRDRLAIAFGAAFLGWFAGLAAAAGVHPWVLGYLGAWLPALLLFVGGVGRERLAFELERLENEADEAATRPKALRRAAEILDETREGARTLDATATQGPAHPGDPRALHAYAAQVVGYALAHEERFEEAARTLSAVPRAWMPVPMRALMLGNLSFWWLCAGDVTAAAMALEEAQDGEVPEAVRPALRAARAAVLVRSGDAAGALDIVGRQDRERGEPPQVRQRYRVTRAHALVALGEEAAARAELERVLDEAGPHELRRWLPARGPAVALLATLCGVTTEERGGARPVEG